MEEMKKPRKPRKPRAADAKPNPWLAHVKKFREEHPELSYKEVLKEAKKTYEAKGGEKPKPKAAAAKTPRKTRRKKKVEEVVVEEL